MAQLQENGIIPENFAISVFRRRTCHISHESLSPRKHRASQKNRDTAVSRPGTSRDGRWRSDSKNVSTGSNEYIMPCTNRIHRELMFVASM